MPAIANTTLEALTPLLVAQIESTVPRVVEGQAIAWKYYRDVRGSAGRSRSFTILWGFGAHKPGGYFTNANVEHLATLTVRVDYAARQSTNTFLIQNDWAQIRDRLNLLTADSTVNGLVSVFQTTTPPGLASDSPANRARLSNASAATATTVQIDLTYEVTYMIVKATA